MLWVWPPFLVVPDTIADTCRLPHPHDEDLAHITYPFYRFRLKTNWNERCFDDFVTVGWILPSTVAKIPWTRKFKIDHVVRAIDIHFVTGEDFETQASAEQLDLACNQGCIELLPKFKQELFRVLDINRTVRISRGGSALFGIQTMEVQMTGYVRDAKTGEMRIWVPRRSSWRHAYPGKLDNTFGGRSIADDKSHFETMVREAEEEGSLPGEFMRKNANVIGVCTIGTSTTRAGRKR